MKKIKTLIVGFFHRKRLIRWGIVLSFFLLLFLFRNPILRGIGFWLINEDPIEKADAVVMLGGNPLERAPLVKKIMEEKYSSKVYCTGCHISPQFKSLGINITEAQNSKKYLSKLGVPDSCIHALDKGTSTIEEAKILLRISKQKNFKKIILVSSKFHTARVKKYFNKIFSGSGIQLIVRGAKPLNYSINTWWHSEEGLLFVNNEYVKSFYYWWNY